MVKRFDEAVGTNRAARRSKPTRRSAVATEPPPGTLAFSVNQVAWVLGVSPNTVWTMVSAEVLPSFTVGRRRLVSRAAVEAFISAGGTPTADC